MSRKVSNDAPHGPVFYVLVLVIAVMGGALFAFASLSEVADAPRGWRVVFGAAAVLFFLGVAQACERIFRPERALARSLGLGGRTRRRLFKLRVGALLLGVIGFMLLSFDWGQRSDAVEAFCADLRVSLLTLFLVYFCLVDLSGERGLSPSTWWYPSKRRRKRESPAESLLQTQERP